jgi:hypothetical protein
LYNLFAPSAALQKALAKLPDGSSETPLPVLLPKGRIVMPIGQNHSDNFPALKALYAKAQPPVNLNVLTLEEAVAGVTQDPSDPPSCDIVLMPPLNVENIPKLTQLFEDPIKSGLFPPEMVAACRVHKGESAADVIAAYKLDAKSPLAVFLTSVEAARSPSDTHSDGGQETPPSTAAAAASAPDGAVAEGTEAAGAVTDPLDAEDTPPAEGTAAAVAPTEGSSAPASEAAPATGTPPAAPASAAPASAAPASTAPASGH